MVPFYLVGDSISIDYHEALSGLCRDRYAYRRKQGLDLARQDLDAIEGANGGDSRMVLAHLCEELSAGIPETHVVVNCGLHDIKGDLDTGELQVPLDEYRRNLEAIVSLIHGAGTRMIWIRTTPVDDEVHARHARAFRRMEADLLEYNAAADGVMRAAGVAMIDLYGFTTSLRKPLYRDHVHFRPGVSTAQAGFIRRELDRLILPGGAG